MQHGYLKLIIGPMFSGKTTALIDIYNNIKNKSSAIVINHASDKRYTDKNELVSHDTESIPCFNFSQISVAQNTPWRPCPCLAAPR